MASRDSRPHDGPPTVRAAYGPTTGVAVGIAGLVGVVIVVVLVLIDDPGVGGLRVILGALAVGVLVWSYLLRPRILVGERTLTLRNAFDDRDIDYAAINDVAIGTATRVRVGERTYVGLAVGHPVRKLLREGVRGETVRQTNTALSGKLTGDATPEYMQDRILERMTLARQESQDREPAPVVRRWAVPELVGLGVLLLAFVVAFFL